MLIDGNKYAKNKSEALLPNAIETELITNDDIFVVRNQLMDILKLTDWNDKEPLTGNIEELLTPLIDYAVKAGIIEDTSVQRDLFDTRVINTPGQYVIIINLKLSASLQRKAFSSDSPHLCEIPLKIIKIS